MKRAFTIFLVFILLPTTFFFSSCKGKEATTGTLTITVMTKDGIISAIPVEIFIAISKENLNNKIYHSKGWIDANGSKIFRDLLPGYYWYCVEGWDDFGAAEVYVGVDASVILWLNTPTSSKK